ncbi:ribosomal protein S18-alanine N-acetyltransferase [Paenibacillus hexagrammi]|uniref:Ribosomal protein S18-alanine N-acetyltransferase n=1 Tax=Paenibacillus hexagrammi TaxID=2908839 RepID=A0ABY3SQH6_9BACL|nr:ribosomal protein S18-alanine N-acetyltransferase [Paenibacillus sp. YPD9-1]UJF36239.1 ribosomal protein S18-alanine N-acetyltransferase [Paenibacillus sp. YPD9-1]
MEQHQADLAAWSIQFRLMRLEDIPEICEIEQESFTTPWTAGAFENELTNNQFAKYMILEIDGHIGGYGGMWLIMDEAHVTNIAVRSMYRGKKLGERLLRELMRTAAFLGALRMTLEVRASNHIAQNLYEKLGFRSVGVRRGYYTDNREDAIIMWADLPRMRRSKNGTQDPTVGNGEIT